MTTYPAGTIATQNVTIVGPNLPKQAGADFHVHAAGCADLKRGWIKAHAKAAQTFEIESRFEAVEIVYDHVEDDDELREILEGEFHFAPCVTLT